VENAGIKSTYYVVALPCKIECPTVQLSVVWFSQMNSNRFCLRDLFYSLRYFSACSWRHYDVQLWYFTKRLTQHSTTYHGGIHWPVNGTSPSVRIGPLLEISVESRSDILKLTVKLRKWFHSANIHAFVCLSPGTHAQNAIYSYSHYIDDQQEVLHKLFKEPVPFLDPSDDLEQWFQGQVCGLGALSQKLSNLDV